MDFELSSEQSLLRDSVRRFLEKEYAFGTSQAQRSHPDVGNSSLWRRFANNGWLGAALPEELGGFGGSVVETAIIAHELGRALVVEPYIACAVLAAQTVVASGSPGQAARIIPDVVDGTMQIALAYSEPGSAGMPCPLTTCAITREKGFLIRGKKTLVLGAGHAQKIIVSAVVAETSSPSLFLVDANLPGMRLTPLPLHDGTSAHELVLQDVPVTEDDLLGSVGAGMPALKHALAHGVIALCASLVGSMEKAIEMTAAHLKERKQFGVSIGSFQVLQHRMADMATELEFARSMLFAGMAALEAAPSVQREQNLSYTKSLIGRSARFICGQAIQLHGGIGMTEEYAIGHHFKHAIVADAIFGSSGRHESESASRLMRQCAVAGAQ